MDTLIIVVAQYLLYVLVGIAGLAWWLGASRPKVVPATEAVLGLVLVGIGSWVAGQARADPRPFTHDPASTPLSAHAAGNGFPSDHSAAAGMLTALVFRRKRLLGVIVAAGALLIAWACVAAHVQHGQDVLAGLGIGVGAGALAIWLVSILTAALRRRGPALGPAQARTTRRPNPEPPLTRPDAKLRAARPPSRAFVAGRHRGRAGQAVHPRAAHTDFVAHTPLRGRRCRARVGLHD